MRTGRAHVGGYVCLPGTWATGAYYKKVMYPLSERGCENAIVCAETP